MEFQPNREEIHVHKLFQYLLDHYEDTDEITSISKNELSSKRFYQEFISRSRPAL